MINANGEHDMIYAPYPQRLDEDLYGILSKIAAENESVGLHIPKKMKCVFNDGLAFVNGVDMYACTYMCNYCWDTGREMEYYCSDCHMDMCHMCYSEVDEETALNNGAVNYKHRAQALADCRTHNLKSFVGRSVNECSSCKVCIRFMAGYYYNSKYDICKACYDSNPALYTESTYIENDVEFGSVRDWFIIVEDDDYNAIICNLNVDSPYYKKFGFLATDGHGRVGVWSSKDDDLRTLLDEYDRTRSMEESGPDYKYEEDPLEGEIDIDCRITRMMLVRKMKVYYG